MAALDDLLDAIFDGATPALRAEFAGWLRESRRFRDFAARNRTKLRAKVRGVRDEGGMADLRAELEAAALLLRDERFTLEYEKYAASGQRGPDFTVTFKTHTLFNVEVRRIRGIELSGEDPDARLLKLTAVFSDKVGQMPPGIVNLLWLVAEGEIAEQDVDRAAGSLRGLAERKIDEFFTRRGFASAADFLRQYQRLSGIVWQPAGGTTVWLNPIARHKTPEGIAGALRRLTAGD